MNRSALALIFITACGSATAGPAATDRETPRATSDDPAEDEMNALAWLYYDDIQGLFGGDALMLWPDGRVLVRVVRPGAGPGLGERRFETQWDASRRRELAELLAAQGFDEITIPARPGIPDEAWAQISVGWDSGARASAGKWAGQEHSAFSAVQGWLQVQIREIAANHPAQGRAFEHATIEGPWSN